MFEADAPEPTVSAPEQPRGQDGQAEAGPGRAQQPHLDDAPARKRRRGRRGGRRHRSRSTEPPARADAPDAPVTSAGEAIATEAAATPAAGEVPGCRPTAVEPGGLLPKPKIGDTRPAPAPAVSSQNSGRRRRRGGRGGVGANAPTPVEAVLVDEPVDVDQETLERRRGRERKGRPVGRYLMVVHRQPAATQIAVLEGRSLIQHFVSRRADDATQIDGNIYLGRVQNVLPGMEAAFVDIGTPKNAVLYRGDVRYDREEVEANGADDFEGVRGPKRLPATGRDIRIEQLLRNGQTVLCQVTKNPIGTKGARLTQEVSLPGRFVVLIPHSDTYGISKRLPDEERKRLRRILDEVRPAGCGLIVRTAAEGATADELRRDVARLSSQWERIEELSRSATVPALLYREPDMAVRYIREEFSRDYRGIVIDDLALFEEVRDYVASITPELADRVEYADPSKDPLPVFERYHVHEQVHKALDRKVWLASGGSLIIERTEALTVIDVNTGKNVGTSNLEETVFRNNLEAAEEVARQLRLRDIGGIIVIDFIDMESPANREELVRVFRAALARDKTRTQVYEVSELGLVEMTRKRVSEGLVESFSETCPTCGGRGIVFDESLL
jgi:ribonuclease E